MQANEAITLIGRLLGSYGRDPTNVRFYIQRMQELLVRYPFDVGSRAVEAVTQRCKFHPSYAELGAALDEEMKRLRLAAARAAREERQRRDRDHQSEEPLREGRRQEREYMGDDALSAWERVPRSRRIPSDESYRRAREAFRAQYYAAPDEEARETLIATFNAQDLGQILANLSGTSDRRPR